MSLDLMSHLADAYGWSKKDLSSFTGGELLQMMYHVRDREKELAKQGISGMCPMLKMFGGMK